MLDIPAEQQEAMDDIQQALKEQRIKDFSRGDRVPLNEGLPISPQISL